MKIREYLRSCGNTFTNRQLLCKALGVTTMELLNRSDTEISDEALQWMQQAKERLSQHEPLQYILEEWDFYGRTFAVGPGVLIPRSDTEVLIDAALSYLRAHPQASAAMDLCAGSGCIGITLCCEHPGLQTTAVEWSEDALSYLRRNAKQHAPALTILQGDLLQPAFWDTLPTVDLIVSNPPYIPTADLDGLDPEVRREPDMALDGGADGLLFYRTLTEQATRHLKPGGALLYEIGIGQHESVPAILQAYGFTQLQVLPDYAGIPRVVIGVWDSVK